MKSDKIKDFAKDLYLQYDEDGTKSFSLREISTEILQKFNKKIHFSTIKNWRIKGEWDKLNEKIKQQSIEKAKDEKFTTEEQITESKSDDLAKTYKHASTLENIGFDTIFKTHSGTKTNLTVKDALTALKYATEIKMRINDIKDPSAGNQTVNIVSLGNGVKPD